MNIETSNNSPQWSWQWPSTGPVPVNNSLDSEIFDTDRVPLAETFVREAIQNSLDARLDSQKPVHISFSFHSSTAKNAGSLLGSLVQRKDGAELPWPREEWAQDKVTWLIVEDKNTTGLQGDVSNRSSDFWNYWLNFGLSNKDGSKRGARGIGRVTFLIASELHAVIGITRRAEDDSVHTCGMSLMKAGQYGEDFKTSHAFLAGDAEGNIYQLHDASDLIADIAPRWKTTNYLETKEAGFSLIIPYPIEHLSPASIAAAAIEHFGPAILNDGLVIDTGDYHLDAKSIVQVSEEVAFHFHAPALVSDPSRVLSLITKSLSEPDFTIGVDSYSTPVRKLISQEKQEQIREAFETQSSLALKLELPVKRFGKATSSILQIAIGKTPPGEPPVDAFFRAGMRLPDVLANNQAEIDLVVQSIDGELATYLNLCEGKAHLDLLETGEVRERLKQANFQDGVSIRRFMKKLMDGLRALVLPDQAEPDASIFSEYFSAPVEPAGKKPKKKRKNVTIVDPPPPHVRAFIVDDLSDGFRVRTNDEFDNWPVNVRIDVAYADGSHKPKWSPYDFRLKDLIIKNNGSADPVMVRNRMVLKDCTQDFELRISGFDTRRELVTFVRAFRDA